MTDPMDRLLHAPDFEPLVALAGHFDEIARRAGARRRRRFAAACVLSAVVVAGTLTGIAIAARPAQAPLPPASGSSPSETPSAPPTQSPSTPPASTPVAAAGLGTGPVPANFRPVSVTYVSSAVGFLLGDRPCGQSVRCPAMVVTGDGGAAWQGLPEPPAPLANRTSAAPTRDGISDVRFANPRDGWLFGGGLWATHDGGRHWDHSVLTPSGGDSVVLDLATDGTTSYAVVATCGSDGSCRSYRLYEGSVGSDAWRPVAGSLGAGTARFIGSLSVSGGRGIVIAGSSLWVRSGSQWRSVSSPPCGSTGGASAAAASASDARLVVFCGEGAAGSRYLTPWVSDDNGAGWRKVADGSAVTPSGRITVAAASAQIFMIASANPDLGGRLLRSSDGGRSFTDAAAPKQPGGWWYVGARSAAWLVAVPAQPDGSLWSSRDAGRTWQAYRFR
ncbi:MAG: sialidase family protein [Mycobacteriales bacterium]